MENIKAKAPHASSITDSPVSGSSDNPDQVCTTTEKPCLLGFTRWHCFTVGTKCITTLLNLMGWEETTEMDGPTSNLALCSVVLNNVLLLK